ITEKRSTGTSSSNNRRIRVRVRHRKRIPDGRKSAGGQSELRSTTLSAGHLRSRKTSRFNPTLESSPPRPMSLIARAKASSKLRRSDSSSVVANVTHAEPSGLRRFPSSSHSFLHHRKGKVMSTPTRSTSTTTLSSTTTPALMSTARSRTRSGFLSFLHKMRHSSSEKSVERVERPRSSRRISIGEKEPSGLVVVRSFCRFPPFKTDLPRCSSEEPLFYYNVTNSACVPFHNGYCGHSRNRFLSEEACLSSCIVQAQGFATNPSNRHFLKFNVHN
ncbi:Papilinlike, partial [Caligus rogercresseyi]